MSEPKRWLDQGAPRDVEQLFRAAQEERPDKGSLGRSLTAVGVGLGATHVAASAKAAGTAASVAGTTKVAVPLLGGVFAKWAVLGTLGGMLAVGVAELATEASRPVAPAPSPRTSARFQPSLLPPDASTLGAAPNAPEARPAAAASPAPIGSTAMTAAPNAARLALSARNHAAPFPTPPDAAPASAAIDADTLAAEVKSIDRARSALAAGKAAQALVVLDEYERLFRRRGFAPEALYLRMEACASLGRTAEARAAAERLLASYPDSLHSARARALVSKNP